MRFVASLTIIVVLAVSGLAFTLASAGHHGTRVAPYRSGMTWQGV